MDDGPSLLLVTLLFAALVGAALSYVFFIAAALAISRARSTRISDLAQERRAGAVSAVYILQRSEAFLVCTQAGRFISVLIAGMVLSELFDHLPGVLHPIFAGTGTSPVPQWAGWGGDAALVVGFIPATLISVQFVKTLALQFPDVMLCLLAWPLKWVHFCFGPLVLFVHGSVGALLSAVGIKLADERDLALCSDDISEFVRRSSQEGVIEKTEQELIEGVVELADTIVSEVMTPRTDTVFVKWSDSLATVVSTIAREGVSRVVVCGRDLDDVRGMLISKDLLVFVGQQGATDWHRLVREVQFVPNTKNVTTLLKEFREQRIHLAVVLDEHGGVDGVVTLEDLVEEIVGDISDEFDVPFVESRPIVQFDGAIIIDASLSLYDLERSHGVVLPVGDYETVAGFVLAQLGRVPEVGESFQFDGAEFTVRDVQQNRVVRISMRRSNSTKNKLEASNNLHSDDEALPIAVDSD